MSAESAASMWLIAVLAIALVPLMALLVPEFLAETSLGIDLGTTFSVAVVCRAGHLTVLQIDGSDTVPSVVYFDPDGTIKVGAAAAAMRAVAPERTVHEAKRLIGRAFQDPVIARESKQFPFSLVEGPGGSAAIMIPPPGHPNASPDMSRSTSADVGADVSASSQRIEGPKAAPVGVGKKSGAGAGPAGAARVIDPKDVSALVLRRLKAAAEAKWPLRSLFGFRFGTATISVPVEFEKAQRAATIAAGKAAGFAMVRLIEEPVAAAIAYGLHNTTEERTVVVYDMGGGTLDVAVLRLQFSTRTFMVMATAGDPHLGGRDFDRMLAAWARDKVGGEIGDDSKSQAEFILSVESAKRQLQSAESVDLHIRTRGGGERTVRLDQAAVQEAARELLERAKEPIHIALDKAGLSVGDVGDVVLVGGATRLQAVRERVNKVFGDVPLNFEIDPDSAIALGAARAYNC